MYKWSIIFFLEFIKIAFAQENDIIRDYFIHKNVTQVIGFSCGNETDQMGIVKMLNNEGMFTMIKPPESKIELKNFFNASYWTVGVFVDLRCSEYYLSNIFDQATRHRMYDYSYNWLILGVNLNDSIKQLNDNAFSITTDLVISVPEENDSYNLYDVYNHCKYRGGLLNITHLGTWRKDDGLMINLLQEKIQRRWNFHGMRLKVAGIVKFRPKNISLTRWLGEDSWKKDDVMAKFAYPIVLHMADIFNFTMDLSELTIWEKNDVNGPMMSGLRNGEIDLGSYPSIMTIGRLDFGRVIGHAWPVRTCFMFRTTPTEDIKLTMLMQPLDIQTWYTVAIFTIFTTILFALIIKFEGSDTGDDDYSFSILATIGAMCQQGSNVPDQAASRIAFLNILIFSLMVYNYYSAAIVSVRLNEPLPKMNDSLYSLVKSGFKLGTQKLVYFDFLLQDKNWEVQYFKKHWDKHVPVDKKYSSVEEGVRKIVQPGFAYHTDPTYAYSYINNYFDNGMICQLTEVHLLHPCEMQMWTSLNGQFEEIGKIGFLKIMRAGLKLRQVNRWIAKKPVCRKDVFEIEGVTIYESGPIFIFLFFMMILSLMICAIENINFRRLKNQRNRQIKDSLPLKV